MINFIVFLQILSFLFILFFGLFVFVNNPKKSVNRNLAIVAVAQASWMLSLIFVIENINPVFFGRLSLASCSMAIPGLVGFAYALNGERNVFYKKIAFFIFSILLVAVSLSSNVLSDVQSHGNYITGSFGNIFVVWMVSWIAMLLYFFIKLKKDYNNAVGLKKLRYKYVFLGLFLFFIPTTVTNLILPNIFNFWNFNGIGPVFSVLMIYSFGYAILKYELMDIRIIIQRGFIFSFVSGSVFVVYVIFLFFFGYLFQKNTNTAVVFSAGVTILIGVWLAPFLDKYLRRKTDKLFFKDRYDYSEALHDLSEILNNNIQVADIERKIGDQLKSIFKIKYVKFLFADKDYYSGGIDISEFNFENLFNYIGSAGGVLTVAMINNAIRTGEFIFNNKDVLGDAEIIISTSGDMKILILLSKKLSGDFYDKNDIRLLKTFSNQLSVAIDKSVLYERERHQALELENKVVERTAEIKKLQEDQKNMMLEISHNLQTPLTVVKGELGDMQNNMPDRKKLVSFERSIDKITKFIYDLLNLASLESGQERIKKERMNLSNLLSELVEYFNVLSIDKKIKIDTEITPDVFIFGDKGMVEELVTNLFSNAVKYIANERRVIIGLKKQNNVIILSVKDTGMGIREEDLPNIFKRFYRTKSGRESIKGTGLGLAIARTIVEAHGGKIEVKSSLGVGTEFLVYFDAA